MKNAVSGRSAQLALGLLAILPLAAGLSGCDLGLAGSGTTTTTTTMTTTGSGGGSAPTASFSVGGTITGLSGSGLVLASGQNTVAVAAGATSFILPTPMASGAKYTVSVTTQPTAETCNVSDDSGTVGSTNVTNVQVQCVINTYTLGGIISGLNASGLVLAETAGTTTATLNVSAGVSAFLFGTKLPAGAAYVVSVQTQPTGLMCQVQNGTAVMPAMAVNNVMVTCGEWTWMGGADQVGGAASYGSRGVASNNNVPGARANAAYWGNGTGTFWLFGGQTSAGSLDDLWSYSTSSGQWTWVAGGSSANASGVYGMQGSPGMNNVPGGRVGANLWADTNGNLWLFGGQGYDVSGATGALNDLWEYNVTSKQWTWWAGADTAWASGSTPPTGVPAARSGAASWRDGSGNLWLFGGNGTQGLQNDLWEYSPAMTQWTLAAGSQTTVNAFGVYGTKSKAATTNLPGGRQQAVTWFDAAGNLWLFGGSGYAAIGAPGLLNDLWEFTPSATEWTWIGGSNIPNASGVYGTQSATAALVPGARKAATGAVDPSGNLWLWGGTGYDGSGHLGSLNDFWEYQFSSNEWVWMGGSQASGAAGVYGTLQSAAPGDAPGARASANAWMDASGDFWLFGGQGLDGAGASGNLNDLWEFVP